MFLHFLSCDKGKPVEKQGRKTTGLKWETVMTTGLPKNFHTKVPSLEAKGGTFIFFKGGDCVSIKNDDIL